VKRLGSGWRAIAGGWGGNPIQGHGPSLGFNTESLESSRCRVSLSLRPIWNLQIVGRRSAHGLKFGICTALVTPYLRPYLMGRYPQIPLTSFIGGIFVVT
jgi:hypothetical protein